MMGHPVSGQAPLKEETVDVRITTSTSTLFDTSVNVDRWTIDSGL